MHISKIVNKAAWLALLPLIHQAEAQNDTASRQLELRFLSYGSDLICVYDRPKNEPRVSTFSVPCTSHCFNLVDLFNHTANAGGINETLGEHQGITYRLENNAAFSSNVSYWGIQYTQHVPNAVSDEDKSGHYADRKVILYAGRDCNATAPWGEYPWVGFQYWSEEAGKCESYPFGLESFSIQPGQSRDDEDAKCWVFGTAAEAPEGAAASAQVSTRLVLGSLISGLLLSWTNL